MLHAAILKGRDEREIKFLEGVWNAGILLKPVQRIRMSLKNIIHIAGKLLGVCLAVKHSHFTPIDCLRDRFKCACDEREEICAQPVRARKCVAFPALFMFSDLCQRAIAQSSPACRQVQCQLIRGLQIWLVKNRKCRARTIWHKKRIKIIRVAIKRRVACHKLDCHRIGTCLQSRGWQD